MLRNWDIASIESDIRVLDEAIYEHVKCVDVFEPKHIRDPLFLHLVTVKACAEIDRIFSGHRGWNSMTFSVRTYFMVYATEINVRGMTRMNYLLNLHPEDLDEVIELLRFFIETKRIENGAGRTGYKTS